MANYYFLGWHIHGFCHHLDCVWWCGHYLLQFVCGNLQPWAALVLGISSLRNGHYSDNPSSWHRGVCYRNLGFSLVLLNCQLLFFHFCSGKMNHCCFFINSGQFLLLLWSDARRVYAYKLQKWLRSALPWMLSWAEPLGHEKCVCNWSWLLPEM